MNRDRPFSHPRRDPLDVAGSHIADREDAGQTRLEQIRRPRERPASGAQLVGKQIVVVANLAPRQMRGEISNGMLLASTDSATGRVIIITPAEAVAAGSKVN